jgi:hypothetical protein
MSNLFKAPKMPDIAPVSTIATPAPTEVKAREVVEEEKKKIRKGIKKNTILTGPLGLTEEAPVLKRTLGGV